MQIKEVVKETFDAGEESSSFLTRVINSISHTINNGQPYSGYISLPEGLRGRIYDKLQSRLRGDANNANLDASELILNISFKPYISYNNFTEITQNAQESDIRQFNTQYQAILSGNATPALSWQITASLNKFEG